MADSFILADRFTIHGINKDGAIYRRVSRIDCRNELGSVHVTSDVNTEEYPLSVGDRLSIAFARTLENDGERRKKIYDHSIYHRQTLMDDFEYVCHGRVYECNTDERDLGTVTALISFGGLLTKVTGTPHALREIHFDSDVYMLLKKIK